MIIRAGRLMASGLTKTPIRNILNIAGVGGLTNNCTHMLCPPKRWADGDQDRAHYLHLGTGGDQETTLTGTMDRQGQVTGGHCTWSPFTNCAEEFSVIWDNAGTKVVAFTAGFDRTLTSAERTALSQTSFWDQIFAGSSIDSADCSALYPYLIPAYQGLFAWFDAAQISGLSDSDPVATWPDKSGQGRDATEATNRPAYKTNILNGLPAVLFDNTNDILQTASVDMSGLSKLSIASVFSLNGAAADRMVMEYGASYSTIGWWALTPEAATGKVNLITGNNTPFSSYQTDRVVSTTPVVLAGLIDRTLSSDEVSLYTNGTLEGSRPYNGNTSGGFAAATPLKLGARASGVLPMNGYFYEAAVYPESLSAAHFANVVAWLQQKWNVYDVE